LRLLLPAIVTVALAWGLDALATRLGADRYPPVSGLSLLSDQQDTYSRCIPGDGAPDWDTGSVAVMCRGHGIAAIDLHTGGIRWKWVPPTSDGSPGNTEYLAAGTPNGIGVVDFTYGMGVNYLAGIDLATGRQLWQLPDYWDETDAWVSAGFVGYRFEAVHDTSRNVDLVVGSLSTGTTVWSTGQKGLLPAGCTTRSATGSGNWVYLIAACGDSDSLFQLDLSDGATVGRAPISADVCAANSFPVMKSVPGYVLYSCQSASQGSTTPDPVPFMIVPSGGVAQHPVAENPDDQFLAFDSVSWNIAAWGETIYAEQGTQHQQNGHYTDSYQVIAVNAQTGALRWSRTVNVPGEDPGSVTYPVNFLGADAHGLIDLIDNDPAYGDVQGLTLAFLSADSGALSYGPGLRVQLENTESLTGVGTDMYVLAGNLLFAVPTSVSDSRGEGPYAIFGTGGWPR
jgi:hypothetical protein